MTLTRFKHPQFTQRRAADACARYFQGLLGQVFGSQRVVPGAVRRAGRIGSGRSQGGTVVLCSWHGERAALGY